MPVRLPSLDVCLKRIQRECNTHDFKLAAVSFRRSGSIITVSANRQLTDSDDATKWTEHAEEGLVRKLRKLKAREREREIYVLVARWTKDRGWAMAKPCEHCWPLLTGYGIDGLYFTNDSGVIENAF